MLRQHGPPVYTWHFLPGTKFIGKFVGKTIMEVKTALLFVIKRVN